MRILAIRGQNLASLERTFELALDAEPLASAGLFAITGSTGAGKSTLLDAMCAALFDRTPRLEGRSPFQVGRGGADQVGAFDVRALLRRGAGEGWAEVDFEGKDRRRYRARWEVHRARRRAEGKLQDQQLLLRRLDDGVVMGGTRGETLKAIEQALGLSFEQFKRSALLAQGEFAAFLRAESSARAALLERVTGTALYGALSVAAHRRASELAAERRARRGELEATPILDDERRAAIVAERERVAVRTVAARARVQALAHAGRWREQLDEAERAEAEAAARAELAARAVAAAGAEARELAAAQTAEPVRGPWRAREQARASVEHARRVAAEAEAAVVTARDEAKRASEQAVAARAARQAGEAEAERLAPAVARAAAVDVELAAAEHELAAAEREAAGAAAAAKKAQADVERRSREVAAIEARLRAVEATLASSAALAPISADGARWAALVRAAVSARAAWTDLRLQLDALVPARHEADVALDAAERALVTAREHHQAALRRADAAEEAARAAPLAPAEQAWAAADERVRRVDALVQLAAEAAARALEVDELRAEAARAEDDAAGASGEAEAAARAAERAAATLAEARDTLERLRLGASLDHARAALRPGEPCALCGAVEHPWAGRGALDALVVEQAARVEALAQTLDGAARCGREASQRAAVARSVAADRRMRAARLDDALVEGDERWRRAVAAAGELALVASARTEEARAWAAGLASSAEAAARLASATRATAQEAATAAAHAQARALASRHDLEELERAREAAAAQVAQRAGRQLALARDLDERARERARLADELAAAVEALPALASALTADDEGDAAAAILERALEAHRREVALAVDLRERLASERTALAAAEAARDQLVPAARRASEASRVRRERTLGLREQRGSLLGGRRVDEVVAGLRAGGERLRRAEHEAVGRATALVTAEAAEASRARAAREHVGAAAAVLAGAERELAVAVTASGLAVDELARHLQRDPAWLSAARARQAALSSAAAQASAIHEERRRQREAVQARRQTIDDALAGVGLAGTIVDETGQAWSARQAAATAEAEAAVTAGGVLAEQLRADDAARARRSQVAAALAAFDGDALPYEELDDLIGSSDGKKLRDFAQSLTLDRLLAAANRHLDDLAPRYQLERVGGLDLELQVVDRELGDDVRAIASLSGGESFLVSLALALGLSSLSSSGVQVRTLLIDEGFGSLDLATLDTALSVLDALRATGRQVGIVSHVPGLDERVPARVVVRSLGGGRSTIEVRA